MDRVVTGALVTTLLLAGATGCGGEDQEKKSLTITGDCSLSESRMPITRIVPESLIRSLVGPGTYETEPGLVVKDGRLPAAYDGRCALVSEGGDMLRLAMYNSLDPSYGEAQRTLADADAEGFSKVNDTTYVLPEDGDGVKAVTILPERIVILRLLAPAEDIDAGDEVGAAMPEVITRIQELSGR